MAVLAGLALLLLAGRLAGPPSAARPPVPRALGTRSSCDPGHVGEPAPTAPTDGPEAAPPVPGLRLEPASARSGDLDASHAVALGRALVSGGGRATVHARLFRMTRPQSHLRSMRAWVVAVAGVPIGQGFCGPLGTREEVVALDARSGHELLRYSYR